MARSVWIAAALAVGLGATQPALADELAIVGAKIYPAPNAAPIADATLVMRDGRIRAVGSSAKVKPAKDAQVIDGHGLVVTAGLWNSHVHLMAPIFSQPLAKDAKAVSGALEGMFTRWGFTTIFDIASLPGDAMDLRRRIKAGEVTGPNILTVDGPFFPNGGVPIYVKELLKDKPSFEVGTPEKAAERARAQLKAGADGVKIFAGAIVGGKIGVLPMPLDAAKAVVAEAHKAGKPAFAHPSNQAGMDVAIDSGVDILAHTTPDTHQPWTPEIVARLKAHNMAVIPTMTLWEVESKKEKLSDDVIEKFEAVAEQQLKAYSDAGGQILFGTDVGYTDAIDTTEEYRLMAAAGLTWKQILASLTTAPAERFKVKQKGRIAPGMDADVTVLNADPAQDARAFANVAYTISGGKVIYAGRR
jgi:imidazolonepropionase-like amidohydrolase